MSAGSPKVRVMLGGKEVGWASGFEARVALPGNAEVKEITVKPVHVMGQVSIQGTFDKVRFGPPPLHPCEDQGGVDLVEASELARAARVEAGLAALAHEEFVNPLEVGETFVFPIDPPITLQHGDTLVIRGTFKL